MAVLEPLKLVIENYPAGKEELVEVPNHPQKPDWGKRQVPFSRELWIEADDYQEQPQKGYFRLAPGATVRLRYAYVVKCLGFDEKTNTVKCEYLPDSRSGTPGADQYKVKGNIHWVSAPHAHDAEVRLYDRLFKVPEPQGLEDLNPHSVRVVRAKLERDLGDMSLKSPVQFERHGYFVRDRRDPAVFNRTVSLRDSWGKTGV
jgi:glutaminyl-tRNA synthetase